MPLLPLPERHMSAHALSIFNYCPLRFRFRYIDNLQWSRIWSTSPEERKAIERGENFHLMARRYYAGLDPAQVADPLEQRQLEHWLSLLQGFLPRSFDREFHPELELRLNRPEMRLLAKFDLVVVDPDGRGTIFDWKTERRFPRRTYLANSMQTLVYRYMLCAAAGAYSPRGRFKPDEVSMIYWNPLFPERWERMTYSESQFEKDETRLQSLINTILRTPPDGFPATSNEKACLHCEYRPICHGKRSDLVEMEQEESLLDESLAWDSLPELP